MKEESILVKAGRKFNDYKGSMNPPVYHSSTILFPTYKDYLNAANGESIYDVINDGVARDYSYSNVGTPTVHYLSNALAEIEGSGQALIYPSGLFALTFAILTFTKAGSHVLIQDNSYYRLKRFAENELPKRGTEVTFYDPTQDITDLIQSNTSLIMIETPGSVAFEISNVEHIVKVAKERGIVTVCDNSWATPLLFKPLDYGIDVALYAVTKYLAGHSDLLMGAIIAEGEIFKLLYESYKNYGVTIQSHDCYLVHRGLRTLHTRMKRHQNTAMEVAKWLEKHSKIKKVLYPALPSHPQHELWKSYFKGASGTFSIVLDREYSCEELSCMVDHMKIFSIGASWGGCDSLILPIDRRSMSRSVMNSDYGGSFIRIFCGLEDPEDLIFDLNDALKRLSCLDFQNDEVGMKLRELLHDIVDVNFGVEIKGVTCNPKRVKGGYLFVCVSERDRIYIDQILSCGAKAIIASDCITNGVIPVRDAGIHIFHPNPQEIYSEIVSRFYQFKQPKYVAAVTGTNGKTSVVEFCRQIWQNAGYNAASIGTLGICINNGRKGNSNSLTTPGADDLYAALRDIDNKNVEHLVLEASSHGVDQYRIHGLKLSAAAFTNFSQHHLDYHNNVTEYLETKKRLFYEILPQGKTAILNADIDEYGALLKIAEKRGNEIITYGKTGSDITLLKQIPTPSGQYLTIKIGDEIYEAFFPILGQFQAYNLLCAIGISGLNYREISIGKLVSPPGRMEKVKPFAFVDYAHTPSALKQALLSLKWHFNKKIILVFGCGGNRDQTKRAEMGKVAQMYADRVIITDDNPRDENPAEIRRGILLHCPNALEIEDRREAIEKGVDIAYNKGMILLVAGKGHERFQIIGNQTFEFSDVEVIKNHVLTC